ncbi:MAG TPA: hypothetical protein VMI13_12750 [Solirubrobacteraceae bacterium]|nr:hypothetical protein [Solirubrobacteraceae bacterium]
MSSSAADAGSLASGNGAAAGRRGPPVPLASVVLACLVLGSLGAFFLTQRLKHTPTAVQAFELTPVFSPYPSSHVKQEAISFKLKRADEATVAIIDSEGDVVATLVRQRPLPRYKQFSLRWNGRRGVARRYQLTRTPNGRPVLVALPAGPFAKPGDYRVEIRLRDQHRTIRSARSFALVAP